MIGPASGKRFYANFSLKEGAIRGINATFTMRIGIRRRFRLWIGEDKLKKAEEK